MLLLVSPTTIYNYMYLPIKSEKSAPIVTGLILTVILFAVWLVGSHAFGVLYGQQISKAVLFFTSRITFWLYFGLIYWYAVSYEKQSFLLWTELQYGLGYKVKSVLLTLLCTFLGAVLIANALKYMGFNMKSPSVEVIRGFSVPLKLLAVVTAAVVEELIFRGYLIPRLQMFFKNVHVPVIISALIFGLGHSTYGTVVNTIVPLFIGLLFGYHYQKYRNIKILIICHFLIDLQSLLLT